MTKIHSPIKDFTGRTFVGPLVLDFKQGVAEHEGDLPGGVRVYLEQAGFGLDSEAPEPEAAPEPPDPREHAVGQVGSKLRDAAVDPRPEDYLPPTNAGESNPHGPEVVAPGIHAVQDVRPVEPGPVAVQDPDAQEAKETAAAAQATSGEPVKPAETPTVTHVDENGVETPAQPNSDGSVTSTLVGTERPAGNASHDVWIAYAVSQGVPEDEAKGLSRNELRDRFTEPAQS